MDRRMDSLQDLVSDVARNVSELVSREIRLLKAELRSNIAQLVMGVVMMFGAVAFAITGLVLLCDSAVEWLTPIMGSRALAALTVGVVALVIAVVLVMVGKSRLSLEGVTPRRTLHSVERDREAILRKAATP